MKIEEGLTNKKNELEELQKDIEILETQALVLKEQVKKYNELKSKSAQLKKTQKIKQREFNTVLSFLRNTDMSYLDKMFPLFADLPVADGKEARA